MTKIEKYPCPHGRSHWGNCPHCLGINSIPQNADRTGDRGLVPTPSQEWEKLKEDEAVNELIKHVIASERERVVKGLKGLKREEHNFYPDCKESGKDCFIEGCYAEYHNLAIDSAIALIEKGK